MAASEPTRLLIVDDDEGLVRLMRKALEREGFTTASAGSGKEAIAWLNANEAKLMLLDLKLQDIEGRELVAKLAAIGNTIPFIIITGQGDERVAVEMMKRGALDYLVKDVQFIEFVPAVVRRALETIETANRLAEAQAALEESKTQLLMVSEREQRRFGAELHDNLGQQLTAIELRCEALLHDIPPEREDLRGELTRIGKYLREAISQTRSLARGLSPVQLGSGGLHEALSELAARFTRRGLRCELEFAEDLSIGNELVAGHIFRIAQEAVTNAVKHSAATEIRMSLRREAGQLRLEISDNGKGLPAAPSLGQGIGLNIMKHRAKVIGGDLEISSKANVGVQVVCMAPEG